MEAYACTHDMYVAHAEWSLSILLESKKYTLKELARMTSLPETNVAEALCSLIEMGVVMARWSDDTETAHELFRLAE